MTTLTVTVELDDDQLAALDQRLAQINFTVRSGGRVTPITREQLLLRPIGRFIEALTAPRRAQRDAEIVAKFHAAPEPVKAAVRNVKLPDPPAVSRDGRVLQAALQAVR